jgi:hypothetical protein
MRRLDLLALPGAGVLYCAGVVMRGAVVTPGHDSAGQFAAWASSRTFPIAYGTVSVAAILAIFGYVALDRRVNTTGSRAGMLLAVAGAGFLLVLFGVLWFAFPAAAAAYDAGNHGAIDVAARAFSGSMPVQILSGLNILGHIGFAVAVWRWGVSARVGAVTFAVAPILQALTFSFPVEVLGQVLFLMGASLIARSAVTRSAAAPKPLMPDLTVAGAPTC